MNEDVGFYIGVFVVVLFLAALVMRGNSDVSYSSVDDRAYESRYDVSDYGEVYR